MDIKSIKKKHKNAQIFELKENYIDDISKKLDVNIPFSSSINSDKEFTYREIIEVIHNNNIKIYITGGTIRNLLQHESIDNDIDLYVDTTPKNLEKIFYANFGGKKLKWYHSPNYEAYFLIGQKECSDEFLEILCSDVFEKKTDAPCNSLFVRYSDYVLFDLSGYGIIDTIKKIWRKPPDTPFDEWMKGREILWRMIKFKLKDYEIGLTLNEKTQIYTYWINNMNKFPKDWLIPWRNNLEKGDIHQILKILEDDSKLININLIDILSVFIEHNIFSDFFKCSDIQSRNNLNKLITNIKESNPRKQSNEGTRNNLNNLITNIKQSNKQKQSQANKQKQSQANKQKQSQAQANKQKQSQSNKQKQAQSNKQKQSQSNKQKQSQSNKQKQSQSQSNKQKQSQSQSQSNKQKQSQSNKQKQSQSNKQPRVNKGKEPQVNKGRKILFNN